MNTPSEVKFARDVVTLLKISLERSVPDWPAAAKAMGIQDALPLACNGNVFRTRATAAVPDIVIASEQLRRVSVSIRLPDRGPEVTAEKATIAGVVKAGNALNEQLQEKLRAEFPVVKPEQHLCYSEFHHGIISEPNGGCIYLLYDKEHKWNVPSIAVWFLVAVAG